jgi:hypothetical protein
MSTIRESICRRLVASQDALTWPFLRSSTRYLTSLASFSPDLLKRRSPGESGACNEQNQD